MFAECFPILDSRGASRAIIKLGEQCMSLARCVIQRDWRLVSTLHYLGAQWASPPNFRNLKQQAQVLATHIVGNAAAGTLRPE